MVMTSPKASPFSLVTTFKFFFFEDSFAFLDANPYPEFGSGSTDPIESGSETMVFVQGAGNLGI
jgi:hypothetical protein